MAGLLDPDFVIGRDGMPMRITPPTDGLLAANAPTWADAWQFNSQAAGDWIDKQRAISAERGLWDDATGLPTAAGVVDAAGQTAQGIMMGSTAPKGIRAYHGSPYDFEAFDTSKIGTGEGAQAYGHGLYFAENEGIARSYRDNLSGRLSPTESAAYGEASGRRSAAEKELNAIHERMVQDSLKRGAQLDPEWGELGVQPLPHIVEQYKPQWDAATARLTAAANELDAIRLAPRPKGSMYEVELKADPEHFLDWDKRLSEQHPRVQEALRATGAVPDPIEVNAAGHFGYSLNEFKTLTPEYQRELIAKLPANHANYAGDPTGQEILRDLQRMNRYSHPNYDKGLLPPADWQPPAGGAEGALREAGIPGIRYLDAGSRRAGEGTSNYVAFDASQIEILRKYLALLTAGGAGGMAAIGRRSD